MPVIPRSQVEIVEEFVPEPTRGTFATSTIGFQAPAGESEHDYQVPFPISILEAQIATKGLNDGDKIGLDINPGTPVGQLPEASAAGAKVHALPASMKAAWEAEAFTFGTRIGFTDMVDNSECLGCLDAIDLEAGTFTTRKATAGGWPAGAVVALTPTLTPDAFTEDGCGWVEMKADTGLIYVGRSKVGGSYVPAGSVMRWRYQNEGEAEVRVVVRLEFMR